MSFRIYLFLMFKINLIPFRILSSDSFMFVCLLLLSLLFSLLFIYLFVLFYFNWSHFDGLKARCPKLDPSLTLWAQFELKANLD